MYNDFYSASISQQYCDPMARLDSARRPGLGLTASSQALLKLAVSSSPRPWIDVFALPEKSNIAVTESDPDPKVRKMSITF